jgi:hypothetical protein
MVGRNVVLLSTWVMMGAATAAAQTAAVPAPGAAHTQRLEASIGYQLLHIPDETYPFGLNFDLAARVHPMFDVVGEFGFARDERNDPLVNRTLTFLNFGAGPRWTGRTESFAPFAQILLGAASPGATVTSATGQVGDRDWAFMIQPGAGVVVPVAGMFGVVGQVDYRRVFFRETGENELRFFAGLRVGLR